MTPAGIICFTTPHQSPRKQPISAKSPFSQANHPFVPPMSGYVYPVAISLVPAVLAARNAADFQHAEELGWV
jgi:hypothetical protein